MKAKSLVITGETVIDSIGPENVFLSFLPIKMDLKHGLRPGIQIQTGRNMGKKVGFVEVVFHILVIMKAILHTVKHVGGLEIPTKAPADSR